MAGLGRAWPQELVITFHKAPFRWWEAGVSKKGAANILRWVGAG